MLRQWLSDLRIQRSHRENFMLLKFQIPRLVAAPWRISDVTAKTCISSRTPPLPLPLPVQHQQKSSIHHIALPTRPRLNRQLTSSRIQTQSPTIPSFIQSFIRFFTRSSDMSALDAAKTKVLKIIDENPVVVFSKSYCPYCRATKSLLTENNAKFFALELDQVDDCSDIQEALKELTKQTTVPNIYINKNHIGGNSDLQSKRPQLKEMLIQAGAV